MWVPKCWYLQSPAKGPRSPGAGAGAAGGCGWPAVGAGNCPLQEPHKLLAWVIAPALRVSSFWKNTDTKHTVTMEYEVKRSPGNQLQCTSWNYNRPRLPSAEVRGTCIHSNLILQLNLTKDSSSNTWREFISNPENLSSFESWHSLQRNTGYVSVTPRQWWKYPLFHSLADSLLDNIVGAKHKV